MSLACYTQTIAIPFYGATYDFSLLKHEQLPSYSIKKYFWFWPVKHEQLPANYGYDEILISFSWFISLKFKDQMMVPLNSEMRTWNHSIKEITIFLEETRGQFRNLILRQAKRDGRSICIVSKSFEVDIQTLTLQQSYNHFIS